jgi:RNA 2',3'-cyclic 3'-phosphodiesterase
MRAFVAIDLSPAVRAALVEAAATLGRSGGDVRWVAEANLHLTLKFLGEIDAARLGEAEAILAGIAAAFSPFEIEVAGVGLLPGAARPRVVMAKVSGPPELEALAGALNVAFEPLGVAPERRPFLPHVTFGRVRSARGKGRLVQGLGGWAGHVFGRGRVEEVVLYESRLSSAGPTYAVRARGRLGGS